MQRTAECGLCGRRFRPRAGGPVSYCARCEKRADREAASRARRVRCAACGKAFQTLSRSVKYCSDPCRKSGYRRSIGRPSPSRPSRSVPSRSSRTPPPSSPSAGGGGRTAKCRVCGGALPAGAGRGRPRSFCSPPCRTEGTRARLREYMRQYLADPEKRAVHAARMRASSARRSAAAGRDRPRRVRCAHCGGEFSAPTLAVRYCSDPCRKGGGARAAAAYRQRRLNPDSIETSRRCRVCSAEFELGRGGARRSLYCSQACRAAYKRAYYHGQQAVDGAAGAEAAGTPARKRAAS